MGESVRGDLWQVRAARGKGKACNLVVSPFMMCSLEMAALTERQVPGA